MCVGERHCWHRPRLGVCSIITHVAGFSAGSGGNDDGGTVHAQLYGGASVQPTARLC